MTTAGDPVTSAASRGALTVPGRSTAPGRRPAPRPGLSPIALLDLAREMAGGTSTWVERHEGPLRERSYELLELTDDLEVWVIHWPTGGHLELHDHGGSSGAFWVAGGTLEERYVTEDRSLRRRCIATGGGAAFGPRYVHDVRNGGNWPATSVHAYSPPMPGMTFYRSTPGGLVAERAEYRTDPSWAP